AVPGPPADGTPILSIRNQNWVVKVDYRNGSGDGHIVWRLGRDGDFTALSTDPYPWFSNQHNAHSLDATPLVLFDNGNTRLVSDPEGHSRGQVWTLDDPTLPANPVRYGEHG